MSDDNDFAFEPIPGLPELPPEGEEILWQGRPDWWELAKSSLALMWVAGYFVALAIWRFVTVMDVKPLEVALAATLPFLILGAVTCGILMLVSYVQARSTLYTITTSRVAMRIGAALTMTLNLPHTRIDSAALDLRKNGTGTIALALQGKTRFYYITCWPHVRPWQVPVQPALRCIPDAAMVAQILGDAAKHRITTPKLAIVEPDALPAE